MTTAAAGTTEAARRPPADWGRAAEGIQMAGIAVFLLLNTSGVLPWSFWLDAIALWPVLLMSAGLKVAFERSRAPWLLLLGPVLVLGSLAWLASGARADVPAGPWASETKPIAPEASRLRLTTSLAGSRLDVEIADAGSVAQLEARSVARPDNSRVSVSEKDGVAQVDLRGGWRAGITLPRKQRWELRLPPSLPVALDLHGAGVRSGVFLAHGRVEDSRIDGVFLATELHLPAPDAPVKLVLNGVFNALHLVVPPGVPVRVEGAGFPFNAVQRGVPGEADVPGYQLTVSGIFSAVTITPDEREKPGVPRPAAPERSAEPRPKVEAEPTTTR